MFEKFMMATNTLIAIGKEKVWIWTEHDRSATRILFPDER